MKILITGVAGHIGSCFARWVLDNHPEAEVWGVDNFSCGYAHNIPSGVKTVIGSLENQPVLPTCDVLYHFAAMAAECLSPFVRAHHVACNLGSSAWIVNHALNSGCQKVVFTSSIGVYGRVPAPFPEDAVCQPIDPYGAGKLFVETDLKISKEQHGLDYCITRPHQIYGVGQSIWQRHRNVLGLWMRATLENQPMLVYGDGMQRRAFTYIDDILPCLWQAGVSGRANSQIINLGGSTPITILEAAELTASIIGGRIEHREPRHEVKDAWATVEKSQELLGYQDITPLSEGIKKMWTWAQKVWERFPERRTYRGPEIEVKRGVYSYWT